MARPVVQKRTRSKSSAVTYAASPTASVFHQSDARIKLLVGPVGSGSSSACLFDCIMRATKQTPDPDGIRKRTVLIARNSYPKLKTTVKRTMEHWLPEATGFELSGQAPISGILRMPLQDGTTVELEFILMAFQDPAKIEEDLRSFEYSDLWINEAKENHPWLLKYGQQRLGRAPAPIPDPDDPDPLGPNPYPPLFKGCDSPTIILDTNMFDDDSWLYKLFYEEQVDNPDVLVLEQPPALIECSPDDPDPSKRYFEYLDIYLKENPEAENIRWLPGGYNYYWNIVDIAPETVWTDVLNRVGSTQSGMPVFSSFYYNDKKHWSPKIIQPSPNYPLIIGIDWGVRYSAYVFCQYYNARLNILDELVIQDKGLASQMEDYVIPLLNTKYASITSRYAVADPSGVAKDPLEGQPTYSYITARWGIECHLAQTNKPNARIEAMKELLRRENGLRMSGAISIIRKGFAGRYKYKQTKSVGTDNEIRYKEEPDKNFYSHPLDALGYVALNVTLVDEESAIKPVNSEQNVDLGIIV